MDAVAPGHRSCNKAVELGLNLPSDPAPLTLVDGAIERLRESDRSLGEWLPSRPIPRRGRAAQRGQRPRGQVPRVLAAPQEVGDRWPRARSAPDLCGDKVRLSGRVDLTVGHAQGTTAGKVLIDLKTGMFSPAQSTTCASTPLVETPAASARRPACHTHHLTRAASSPRSSPRDVLAAVDRTAEGVARPSSSTPTGGEPVARTGPVCRWCPPATCAPGHQFLADPPSTDLGSPDLASTTPLGEHQRRRCGGLNWRQPCPVSGHRGRRMVHRGDAGVSRP